MLFKLAAEGHFSAIAASFNPALKRDRAKTRGPLAPRWAHMKRIAVLFLLFVAVPVAAADEWQWVKVTNNASRGWQPEMGVANVTIKGQSFEATLFWGPAKTTDVRITLKGTISKEAITATETVLDTDLEPSKYHGRYNKQTWKQRFEGAIGTEAITLSDGYNLIGLRRNFAK